MTTPFIKIDHILTMIGEFAGDSYEFRNGKTMLALNFTRNSRPSKRFPNGTGNFTSHIRIQTKYFEREWTDEPFHSIPNRREQMIREKYAKKKFAPWEIERAVEKYQRVLGKDWKPVLGVRSTHHRACYNLLRCLKLTKEVPSEQYFADRDITETEVSRIDEDDKKQLIALLEKIELSHTSNIHDYNLTGPF